MTPKNKNLTLLRTLVKKFVGLPLTLISFFFIFKLVFDNWTTILTSLSDFNPTTAVLGVVCIAIFFLIKAHIWQILIEKQGHSIPLRTGLYRYALGEIKRYTPGNIFSFVARVVNYEALSVPKSTVIKLILVETLLIVIASALASLPALPLIQSLLSQYVRSELLYVGAFFAGLAMIAGTYFIVKKKNITLPRHLIDMLFYMILAWTFFGVGNYLIAISFTSLDPRHFLQFSSFFVLSWLIGYLSLITPSGLGVREAVITVGLASFMSISVAGTLSLLLRLAMIAAELLVLLVLSLVYKLKTSNPTLVFFRKLGAYPAILLAAVATYISYFTYVSFQKHLLFFTGRYDLGNMEQTVWNTLHGRFFTLTHPDINIVTSRLAVHADFILVLLTPLYALWQDARMLLLIQTIVIALGSIFIYKISQVILKHNALSLAFSISYLLNPFVQEQNLFDFHAVSLVTTLFLAAFYYLLKERTRLFVVFLILAVLTKEHIWAIAGLFGIYIFIKKSKVWGSILTIVSFITFYILIAKFIPDARSGEHFALTYYDALGESPKDILFTMLTHPQNVIELFYKNHVIDYLGLILLPAGFLSFFAPFYLLIAAPEFAVNLLSSNPNLRSYHYHYAAAIIPFMYISAIYGVQKIMSLKQFVVSKKAVVYYIVFMSLFSAWYFGLLPGAQRPDLTVFTTDFKNQKEIKQYLDAIPENVSVGATNNVAAHLIKRQEIYTLPYAVGKAELLVFLVKNIESDTSPDAKLAQKLYANPKYREIYKINDFRVFRKIE